jgi:hypothetical protein
LLDLVVVVGEKLVEFPDRQRPIDTDLFRSSNLANLTEQHTVVDDPTAKLLKENPPHGFAIRNDFRRCSLHGRQRALHLDEKVLGIFLL